MKKIQFQNGTSINAGTTFNTMQDNIEEAIDKKVSVGSSSNNSELWVSTSRNLLPNNLQTQTLNGITFTNNGDGTIKLNGTSTTLTYLLIGTVSLGSGTYSISTNAEGSTSTYYIRYGEGTAIDSTYVSQVGSGSASFTINGSKTISALMVVRQNQTLSNVIVKPMLNRGSEASTFEAFKTSAIQINNNNTYEKYTDTLSVGSESNNAGLWVEIQNILKDAQWEQGSIGGSGETTSSSVRIRTKDYISVDEGTYLIEFDSNYYLQNIVIYDSSKKFISYMTDRDSKFSSTRKSVTIPSDAKYIKVIFRNTNDNTNIVPSEITNINPSMIKRTPNIKANINGTYEEVSSKPKEWREITSWTNDANGTTISVHDLSQYTEFLLCLGVQGKYRILGGLNIPKIAIINNINIDNNGGRMQSTYSGTTYTCGFSVMSYTSIKVYTANANCTGTLYAR